MNWESQNNTSIDYNALPDSYTAIAKYTGTATSSKVTGYMTTAEYKGELSKTAKGKTLYTAIFAGTPITPEEPDPPKEPTIEELEQQLAERKEAEETKNKVAKSKDLNINPLFILIPILVLGLIGGFIYLLLFLPNVKVFNLNGDVYNPLGKVRLNIKNPVIDLTKFEDEATTTSFIIVLTKGIAKRMDDSKVTINYIDKSFQHIVEYAESDYQIEVDF